MLAKYLEFTFNKAVDDNKDMHWCPNAGCNFVFYNDESCTNEIF